MLCAISGDTPRDPVFCSTTHLIYERALIEKAISESDKCPVTGEVLSRDTLIEIRTPHSVKSRGVAAGTPLMIHNLQKEWDEMVLEVFTLRQQLDLTRKELAQGLYQHDAACRVVARLIRERDEALELLKTFKAQPWSANAKCGGQEMEVEAPSATVAHAEPGVSTELLEQLNTVCKSLSTGRKHRKASDRVLKKEQMGSDVSELYRVAIVQSSSTPVVTCVDSSSAAFTSAEDEPETRLLTGDSEGTVQIVDMSNRKVIATSSAHAGGVTAASFLPGSSNLFISAGEDRSVQTWKLDHSNQLVSTFKYTGHTDKVTSVAVHPNGSLAISASEDFTWRMLDVGQGLCLKTVKAEESDDCKFSAAKLHPDGLVLGLGAHSGAFSIWDIREQQRVALLKEHTGRVTSVDFSENGYLAATGSEDGTVRIWDLRKLKCTKTLELGMTRVNGVRFDFSGTFLAVAGATGTGGKVSVSVVKEWKEISSHEHATVLTDAAWGAFAHHLFATAHDGAVCVFGAK